LIEWCPGEALGAPYREKKHNKFNKFRELLLPVLLPDRADSVLEQTAGDGAHSIRPDAPVPPGAKDAKGRLPGLSGIFGRGLWRTR
jgi:hypothetical protein